MAVNAGQKKAFKILETHAKEPYDLPQMETFRSILDTDAGAKSHKVAAYAWLLSEMKLNIVASELSEATGLRFIKSDAFDECEAYVAGLDVHDITILQPKEEKNGLIDFMIEPGHLCEFTGDSTDFTREIVDWFNANAAGIGKLIPMEQTPKWNMPTTSLEPV